MKFKLSEKITPCNGRIQEGILEVKDVKEFIRLLKSEFKDIPLDFYFNKRIDKLVGEELTDSNTEASVK